MQIAFIGGTGFIGHAAATLAVARGHEVVLLHRGAHPIEVLGAREVLVDRADGVALSRALRGVAAHVIVDTRAMTRGDALTSAAAIAQQPSSAVVLSSQDVYAQLGALNGHPAPPPEPEVMEASPLTVPYPFRGLAAHDGGGDYDKKDVEAVFAQAVDGTGTSQLLGVTILRLPAVYGRRDPHRRFGAIVDALDDGESLPMSGGAAFRWTHSHVDDVAHAVVLAAEARRSGFSVYNVGEAETPSMRERAMAIAQAADLPLVWREAAEIPSRFSLLGIKPNDLVVSSAQIRRDLGYAEITTEAERMLDLVDHARRSRAES